MWDLLPIAGQLAFAFGTTSGVRRIYHKKTTWEHSLPHRKLVLLGQTAFLVWGLGTGASMGFLVSAAWGVATAVGTLWQVWYYRIHPGGLEYPRMRKLRDSVVAAHKRALAPRRPF